MARTKRAAIDLNGLIPDNYTRDCFYCYVPLVPTGELESRGGSYRRRWDCPKCGKSWYWVNNPTRGWLYRIDFLDDGRGGYGCLVDPRCNAFPEEEERALKYTIPTPEEYKEKTIIIAYDENDKPVYRWNYGKKRWILIERT